MHANYRIYAQLKLIAKIEEYEKINAPDFSEYYIKPHDISYNGGMSNRLNKYYIYKFHLANDFPKKKKSNTIIAANRIRNKYRWYKINKIYDSSPKFENWFDKLPSVVQSEVFSYLDHQSLINFSYAFPKYIHTVMRPQYWGTINCHFHDFMFGKRYFSLRDVEVLCRYLNKHMTRLCMDWFIGDLDSLSNSEASFNEDDEKSQDSRRSYDVHFRNFKRIFNYIPNLIHFQSRGVFDDTTEYLIDLLIDKCPKLRYLDIESNDLWDEELMKITKMENLECAVLYSTEIKDDVLTEFFNKAKKLVYLSIDFSELKKAQ
jgi:hypothetical protein